MRIPKFIVAVCRFLLLFTALLISVLIFGQTNYSSLYNSSNFIKTIDLSRPVGTIGAAAGTTATGGVTYSIPVYAPPGTNGMQPSISITYNSQGGSGIVGFGWNIAGLSVISRTGKNLYHNNVVSPVSYTSDDAFLLDGVRLNQTGPIVPGSSLVYYRTEAESFSWVESLNDVSTNNPYRFLVTAKDGSMLQFGYTDDSKVMTDDGQNVMLWRLNRIIDINGNYVDFKYDNSNRDTRIDEINYPGNTITGLLPYNKIKFNYGSRFEINTAYEGGASMSNNYLLNNITITHTNNNNVIEQVKKYQFNYGFDNVHSLLKEVEEFGAGVVSPDVLNSTIFLYGDPPVNTSVQTTVPFVGECLTGDFNGDGKTDILAGDYYYVHYDDSNNPGGYGYDVRYCSGYKIRLNPQSITAHYEKTLTTGHTIIENKKFVNFLTSDYNQDGRDDVFLVKTTEVTYPSGNVVRYLNRSMVIYTTNTGSLEAELPIGSISNYYYIHSSGNFLIPGDFDGDGNQDIITMLGNSGNKFHSPAKFLFNKYIYGFSLPGASIVTADNILPIDFNGDGKHEVLAIKDNQAYVFTFAAGTSSNGDLEFTASIILTTAEISKDNKIFVGDFNGDRKNDLLIRQNDGVWKIMISTGINFITSHFSFNQVVNMIGQDGDDKIIISDFNGDSKSDILHGYNYFVNGVANTSKLSLYYSKGYSASASFYYEQYDYNHLLPLIDLSVGDFNGDGRSDLLLKGYYPLSTGDIIYFKPNGKERLLTKVTDGHNVTSSFDYKYLTDKSSTPYVYNRTVALDDPVNLSPFNYVQLPVYVVSSIVTPDGIGGNNTTSFYYEDAVVHRYAKGFLGFKKLTAVNANAGITSVTENNINTQFAVPYTTKQTTKRTATNKLLSESNITNSFINLSTGSNIRFFQKVDKVSGINYLLGTASETVNTYDSYGNITTNVSKVGVLSGNTVDPTETTTTTAVFSIHNTPFPAKPDNITVSKTRTGMAAQSSTTTFTYTSNGLPATQRVFSGLPKAVTTTYSYNSFGNVIQTVTSSPGLSNRTATATYDIKGRFPITKQVVGAAVTQTESYTYDGKWGTPLSHTSTDCLITTFEYDAFGRLKKTNLPEGYSVNNTLVWEVQGQQVFYSFIDFPGGKPDAKTWIDKLGREIKTQKAGFNNQWLTQLTTYDYKGNVSTKTNEYYPGETPLVTTMSYDVYNRPVSVSNLVNTITTYTTLSGGKVQVTTQNSAGQSNSKITDATGKTITAIDNGGQLDFTYDSRGNQTETKHGSTVLVTSVYDVYGRQTSLTDKNAGTVSYDYDAYGELIQQTDALNNIYTMLYDAFGRIATRQGPEGTTTYEYNTGGGVLCKGHKLKKVTGFNGVLNEYTYNILSRIQSEKVTVDGVAYTTIYSYDTYGNLTTTTYPSGVLVNNVYDANGGLSSVTGGDSGNPVTLFTANAVNGFGQYTNYTLGNGKTSQHTYNYGIPVRSYTPGVQDLNFTFNLNNGNLTSRYEAIKNLTEIFQYDNLNRLTTTTVNGVQQLSINYDGNSSFSMGNIASKTDAGNYVYYDGSNGINKIHAVAYITNPAGPTAPPITISPTLQQLTYTPFLKTATVTEGSVQTSFTYGPDYQRVKSELFLGGVLNTTKYYPGTFERIINGGITRDIHYISVGNSLAIIEKPLNGNSTIHFVYTDYLGSLLTRTDINGNITAEQNFDAWGRLRNPNDWQYAGTGISFDFFDRGYTGHEYMPYHALVNMNGRMYDPIQARMLSPDNYVPDPWNTQGYNRYTYANNNPLVYVDPDGNFWHIVIGAIIGGVINLTVKAIQGKIHSFGDGLKAFGVGALAGGTAAITGGVALSYTGLSGASVFGGAVAGFAGSAVASPILGVGNNIFFGDPYSAKQFGKDLLIGTLGGAVVGGTIGGLKGNNIWRGEPVAQGRNIFSWNNTPIENPNSTTFPQGTFGGSGDTHVTFTRGDGVEIVVNGNDATDAGALTRNIKVQGNPQDLWKWISADPTGTLSTSSNQVQIFSTSRITYTFYIGESNKYFSIQVFDKLINKTWLRIRF